MPNPIPGDGSSEEAELEHSLFCKRDDVKDDKAGETATDESEDAAGETGACKGYGRSFRPLSIAIFLLLFIVGSSV